MGKKKFKTSGEENPLQVTRGWSHLRRLWFLGVGTLVFGMLELLPATGIGLPGCPPARTDAKMPDAEIPT